MASGRGGGRGLICEGGGVASMALSVKTSNSNAPRALSVAPEKGGGVKGWWMRACQQRSSGWTPRPNIGTVLGYYIAVSTLLLALGETSHPLSPSPPFLLALKLASRLSLPVASSVYRSA